MGRPDAIAGWAEAGGDVMPTLAKGEKKPLGTTPLEALTFARALIERPENWCQKTYGGLGQYCMTSALSCSVAYSVEVFERACGFLGDATDELGRDAEQSLTKWNDAHTHADVLKAYDIAIARAAADDRTEASQS